ncbi:MAG: response regulator [Candidatus Thorarchaeota archaeon]|jgi:DNA-binding NarL/FixJ family response regulator
MDDLRKKEVVIAGDVPFLRSIMRMTIEDAGFSVSGEVADSQSLMIHCAEKRPSIVLLDLHISEMESVRLIEDLVDIDENVSIIAISEIMDGYSELVLASGARAFLQKPFSMYDLLDIIQKVAPVFSS